MNMRIEGGHALVGGRFEETTIDITPEDDGRITLLGSEGHAARRLSADGLFVFPGIVDIHGDAFERQVMPRPGVGFPIEIALFESDRQAVANGITTVFHGVTWSWEPGLRGAENARNMADNIERLRPRLAADTRLHLRHEIYNLDAESEIVDWLSRRRIDVLAFNDHMSMTVKSLDRPQKREQMVQRCGLTRAEFDRLVDDVQRRADEVPGSVDRLAAAGRSNGVPLLSHDDDSPDQRRRFRSLGSRISEFPTNMETAEDAAAAGDFTVFGAPNVVRGGSHTGWTNAADMVSRGLCSILASDYYYPAPLLAAFRLSTKGVLPLNQAWTLISETPARAIGLQDRGDIAIGQRADIVLVDAQNMGRPHVVATIIAGRLAYLSDATRLR
jgi:alpha-D-ribose 1-methylphosphonate 5-triphosphate diphosphatase